MDEKDKKILEILKKDSRKTFKEIGAEIGLTDVAAKNRVKKLIDKGILREFTVRVNPEKIGYSILTTIGIQVDPNHIDEVIERIMGFEEFYSIWKVSGAHNLHVRGAFRDNSHMNSVIEDALSAEGVRGYHLSTLSEELKHEWTYDD